MTKFTGNSYYLIIRILFLFVPIFLVSYIISQPGTADKGLYGGIFIIGLFLVFILLSLKNLVRVDFNDHSVNIIYLVTQKKVDIPFSKILKWECLDGQRGQHYNIIHFYSDKFSRTKKVRIDRIVDSDKFILFVSWLKSKNNKIEFKISPSDSKLIKPFNKEFG